MHILIINPNTTAAMTASIEVAALKFASTGTQITAKNPTSDPASIQGPEDGKAALPGLYKMFEKEVHGEIKYDAVIIACFDDTGLWELRSRTKIPVIGIGEAGYQAAMLLGKSFSVVTTLAASVPVLQQNLKQYGYANRCTKVRASGVPVLDLETDSGRADILIRKETQIAIGQDMCDTIVLGCAGMARLAAEMTEEFGLPVIDGVAAAVGFSESLVRMTNNHV